MLDIHKDDGNSPKINFTHSLLPTYIDPRNVSTKKKPFSTFKAQECSHTLDLLLPTEMYALMSQHFAAPHHLATTSQYARVFLKLSDILSGDFFNEYIKKGNIMMRSEGRRMVDNVFSLHEGRLKLEVDKRTYEKCGLQGHAIEDGGKKHARQRWVIEFDLRSPSMTHGKKGFGRLEWAAKNVLNQSLTWLFYNANPSSRESLREGKEPVSAHHPFVHDVLPVAKVLHDISVPRLTVGDLEGLYDQDNALDLLEWLHLLALDSPRIGAFDRIDHFLSRYQVPDLGKGTLVKDMVRVRWRGFLSPEFVRDLFLLVRGQGLRVDKGDWDSEGGTQKSGEGRWFAMMGRSFDGDAGQDGDGVWTVMQFAGRETLVWERPR